MIPISTFHLFLESMFQVVPRTGEANIKAFKTNQCSNQQQPIVVP